MFAVLFLTVVCSDPTDVTRSTTDGVVVGTRINDTMVWRGIPFAAPPVGDNRMRPPQPVTPWSAPLTTTSFGPSCLQMGSPGAFGSHAAWVTLNLNVSKEDCLYLNVYSPAKPVPSPPPSTASTTSSSSSSVAEEDALLPVMVYLHAGEFRFGAANDAENGFPYFAHGKVVLVTANARLGIFGFAALDALRSRDTASNSTGNYGMQDQRAVLQWVQANIESFGGDPSRVTIFGESSGGSSVAFHLTSKRSHGAGLLHQAIMQSPGLTQSKPWDKASVNTEMAVSVLTAAGSPGCKWGDLHEGDDTYWIFPGMEISSYHLVTFGTAPTAAAGATLCDSIPACVGMNILSNGTAITRGTGRAGNLTRQIFIMHSGLPDTFSVHMKRASAAHAVDCLLQADKDDLVAVDISPPYDDNFYTDAVAPTEDGVELTAPLQQKVRKEVPANVNLLGGSNLDEGTEFMDYTPPIACSANSTELLRWSNEMYGAALGARVPSLYHANGGVQLPTPVCRSGAKAYGGNTLEYMIAMRSAGDSAITCRIRDLLLKSVSQGGRGWWYQFTATPLFSLNMGDLPASGAFHGAEVPFVFGYPAEIVSGAEHKLSKSMGCFWTNFAATGNPNEGPDGCIAELGLPAWPSIGTDGDAIRFTNDTIAVPVSSLKKNECNLFAQYP